MDIRTDASNTNPYGATVVINHRVRPDQQNQYDTWLNEIGPICRASVGLLDWQIIRPIAGITETYTVVIRFDTIANLKTWMNSPTRKRLIEQVRPLLAKDDAFFISSGLDFWFVPEGAQAKIPVRWKQFLLTWSVIYPLVLAVPMILAWPLQRLGVAQHHYLSTLCITGSVVFLMVYVVMPRYTRLVKSWLFR